LHLACQGGGSPPCPLPVARLDPPLEAKAFNDTELLKPYLVVGNRIINFVAEPTENVTVKHLTKHMAYVAS